MIHVRSRLARHCAAIGIAVLAMLVLDSAKQDLLAQGAAGAAPPGTRKLGDACQRHTDLRTGVVKRDACGRWYCGRTDVKDVIENRPNVAEEIGCVWTLQGDRCRCIRNQSRPK
jgi:hypothetical protein